jgi:hypothetical protein
VHLRERKKVDIAAAQFAKAFEGALILDEGAPLLSVPSGMFLND